jgi:hypothetical protein
VVSVITFVDLFFSVPFAFFHVIRGPLIVNGRLVNQSAIFPFLIAKRSSLNANIGSLKADSTQLILPPG